MTPRPLAVRFFAVSAVTEVKAAAERLSAKDHWQWYRWLGELKDVQRPRREDLRREIALGLGQADRGDLAGLPEPAKNVKAPDRSNSADGGTFNDLPSARNLPHPG